MQIKYIMPCPQLDASESKEIKSVVCQTSEVPSEIDSNHPVQVRLNELNRAYNETLENVDNL